MEIVVTSYKIRDCCCNSDNFEGVTETYWAIQEWFADEADHGKGDHRSYHIFVYESKTYLDEHGDILRSRTERIAKLSLEEWRDKFFSNGELTNEGEFVKKIFGIKLGGDG